jgi:lipid A 3-O-deacylase
MKTTFPFWYFTAIFVFTITHATAQLNFVRIQESNDIFSADNNDRYFTQGLKLEVMSNALSRIYKQTWLDHVMVIPKTDTTFTNHASLSFTQEFYTPADKTADTILRGDRPFAGVMFLSFRNISVSPEDSYRITTDLSLGVLGPASLSREMQNGIHTLFSEHNADTNILGWNYQLRNDLYLNYLLRYEKIMINTKFLQTSYIYQFDLGTIHDDFGFGGRVQFGVFDNYFDGNLGYITRKDKGSFKLFKQVQCYLFFNPVVKLVLWNSLLQGGIIGNFQGTEPYTMSENDISRLVVDGSYGATLVLGRFNLQLIQYFKSREFDKGYNHRYGNISLTYSW